MKRNRTAAFARNVFVLVMALMLCTGVFAVSAAANDPLKPLDVTSADGNVTLHKQAERIGREEWEVTVSADVKNIEVEPPKLEVVFVLDVSSTMNACAVMDQHNSYFSGSGLMHTHTENCPADCTAFYHVHVTGSPSSACYKMGGANGTVYYPRRIEVAKEAVKSLVGDFPEGTIVKYTYFSTDAGTIDSYDKLGQYDIQGQTYIMKGVDLGISQFSNNDTSKVLVLVTDGEATDGLYTSTAFELFDGMVFTVGFNHEDPNLGEMAKNGGDYFTATNPGELTEAFDEISAKITTMVVDPMGPKVNFDITGTTPTNGSVSTVGSTIYWTPDDNQKLVGKVVEYSYTVKLKDETDRDVTTYTTPLNNPTSFRYGIEQNGVTDMTELNFPIPEATYAYSSVQVKWVDQNENALTIPGYAPTEVEKVVSDYKNTVNDGKHEVYTPEFTTDYKTITQRIEIPGSDGAYYQYIKTTYTANGDAATGVNPANAVAHEVVHHYVRVEPPKVGNLELRKVIPAANATMKADSFTFAVKGPDGFTGTVSYTVNGTEKTGTVGADGVLTLTGVKADDVILLKDVPVGDYAVTETAEAGNTLFYDATYSNEGKATVEKDETASLTVTNKPTETVFTKIWDDEGNRYGLRPTAEDFVKKLLVLSGKSGLKAGCQANDFTVEDEAVIVIRTNVEGLQTNAWHVVALGLPKLETGYSYYLAEMDVSPYEAKDIILTADFTYIRDNKLNTHSFNVFAESTGNVVLNCLGTTVSATVTKVWDDKDNQDGKRPETLTVTLSDGTEVELNEGNSWTATVENLPKYEDGQEITYTWTEGELPEGYELTDTSVSGTVTTLTNTHTPETISVEGSKTWNDQGNQDGKRPASIMISLLANGELVRGPIPVTAEDNWSWIFTSLPKYEDGVEITYTVAEEPVPGYTTVVEGVNVTNSYTPELTSATVTKVWDDKDNQDGKRPETLTVTLSDGTEVELNEGNSWTAMVENLPKYEDGQEITYTWTEGELPEGYELTDTSVSGTVTTLTNTHTPETISVEGSKTWNDQGNQDGKRPASIMISLLANGELVRGPIPVTAEDNWSWIFTSLPKYEDGVEITYTVAEEPVPGYTTVVEGVNVTNSYTPELTSATVTKAWDDKDNQDGKRPDTLTVTLSDGTEVELNEGNSWTATVENLPKYKDGVEISYTWTEGELPEGYTLTNTSKEGTVTTLTNTHTPELTSATVTKVWDDKDNQDGKRPATLTVTLSDGTEVELNEGNSWTATVENLPKYEDGQEIVYTWTEGELPEGYELTSTSKEGTVTTLTNTHTPELTSATVTKVWDDKDDQDGKRPDTLTVTLSDGTEVELNEGNSWTATVENLPKYEDGQEIVYTWTEGELPEGYELTDTSVSGTVTTLTNTHTPETISVEGSKAWNDQGNQDGKRPASIMISLLANGELVRGPITVTAEDNWSWIFTVLPKYEDGVEITYTVAEEPVPGYTTVVEGVNVTNSYTPELTSATVTKVWDDKDDQDGKRPETLTVTLSDGTEVELNEGNSWTATVENLPKYEDGQEIVYTWMEGELPEGYTLTNTSKEGTITTLTNTHTPELTSATVTKVWDDKDNQDGKRPDTLTVTLSDGTEVELNEGNSWTATVENLPKYEDGQEIVYTWTEGELPEGYTLTNTSKEGTVTTLTNTHTPEMTSATVVKVWDDQDNQDGKRPAELTVTLLADGIETEHVVSLSGADGWTATIGDLPKYADGQEVNYTWTENSLPEGYELTGIETVGTVTTLTNSYNPEATQATVKKIWDDKDNQDGKRPDTLTVTLSDGTEVELNEGNSWTATVENLPKYEDGKEITYTWSEGELPEGYTLTNTSKEGTITTLTNTHTPETISVEGSKTWNDQGNQDGKRPASIMVSLLANGELVRGPITVTSEDNWSWIFTVLPKYEDGVEITYTVAEEPVPGYTTVVEGVNVTNSYTPELTSATVTKVWDDKNNQDGKRPDTLTVTLSDGTEVELNEGNSWTATVENLPKYEDGKEIVYTWSEGVLPEGYTLTNTSKEGTITTLTNTHTPELTSATVTKVWDDKDDQDGKRPDTLTVTLSDGTEVELNEGNDWTAIVENLPKYEDGKEITYTWTEGELPEGYTLTTTSKEGTITTLTNTHTPELTSATVTKVWDDKDDQDGKRPDTLTVTLSDGTEVELNEGNSWTATVENLPKYEDGQEIVYTWTEGELPEGYELTDTSVSGTVTTLTNSYTPKVPESVTASLAAKKTVNGSGNVPDGHYSFTLYEMVNGQRKQLETVKNTAGNVLFTERSYTEAGTYQYLMVEVPGNDPTVIYDTTEHTATVTVTKNADGELVAKVAYGENGTSALPVFANTKAAVSVKVTKVWDHDGNGLSNTWPAYADMVLLVDGEWPSNGAFMVELNANNNWTHEWTELPKYRVEDGELVEIEYEVLENNEYTGYVSKMTENGGQADAYAYTVTNTYVKKDQTLELKVPVKKIVNSTAVDEDFTFILSAKPSDPPAPMPTNAPTDDNGYPYITTTARGSTDGETVYFETIDITAEKVLHDGVYEPYRVTYGWTVREEIPEDRNEAILYDEGWYEILATFCIDEDGKLTIANREVWDDDWENIIGQEPDVTIYHYDADWNMTEIPYNNGNFILPFTNRIRAVDVSIPVSKVLAGADGKVNVPDIDGKYTFTLSSDDRKAPLPETTMLTLNTAENMRFGPIVFTKPGTYTYKIEESGNVAGIINDTQEKTITIVVTEDENGNLVTNLTNNEAEPVVFTNKVDDVDVSVTVKKVWDDSDNQDGKRPASLIVTLSNGTEVTLTAENNWTATVENLPKYKDGVEISYTWTEAELPEGYELTSNETEGTLTTLTNTYTPEVTSATVIKVWDDSNNQDGKRPASLIVTLSNGEQVELTAANNWTATVENLPKYADGVEIAYTWTEAEMPENYELTGTAVNGTVTTLTNHYPAETTEATVKKVWDDSDNQDGKRPASLIVTLSNGDQVELTEANNWTATVENLPKYKDGVEISYTWTEGELPEGYTLTGTTVDGTVTTLTNHYPAEMTEASVIKVWDDSNNQDGKRPASLIVTLSNGEQVELTAANNWTATVENLPKYKDSVEITYTWTEGAMPDGYELTGTTVDGTVTTLTNHYPAETTEATVIKVWDDSNNRDGKRPAELTVTLSNGTEVTLTEANNWTATVEDLPKYADGKEISYTWTEGAMPDGYELTGTAVNGTVTTLTNYYPAETTEATIVKVWDDSDNQDGKRPASLIVTLSNGEQVELTAANNWTATVENLPKYEDGVEITYTWTEGDMPENYELTGTTVNGTVTTLTNHYPAETTEATVKKVWDDNDNQDGKRPAELTVTLSNGTEVTLTEANNWTATVEDLPKYADGKEITYTWTEGTMPDGYELTNTTVNGTVTTLTNHYPAETTEVTVIKVWDDSDNQDGKRPAELTVTLSNGTEVTLSEANNWTATVENLPKYEDGVEITYTWTEGAMPDGYELTDTTVDGTVTTLTNHYPAETTEATVKKVWDDSDNQDGKRPASLIVTLSNGTEVTLTEANDWTATVENLPKYKDGVEITYTWTEGAMPENYELTGTTVDGTVTTLTNHYPAETTEATVVKVWDDSDNQDGKRPASLLVTLSNGTEVTLTEANNWTATVENLPKYADGKEIAYTWTEGVMPDGYELTDTTVDGTVTTLTNHYPAETTEATVVKVWDDSDNQDGKRPASLLVTLSNGTEVTLTEANNWTATVENLPKYEDGKEITYTWTEGTMPDGYELTSNETVGTVTTLTNHYPAETTEATVIKVWDDSNNQDGKRPASLTVTLSNGEQVELTAENNWTATVENLPKYADGVEITYTWTEGTMPDGYKLTSTTVDGTVTTLTNHYPAETTEATIVKVWDDSDNQDGKRPASLIVTLSNGTEVTLTAENNWTATVENLPKYKDGVEISYTWTEAEMPEGYELTSNETVGTVTTLTNHYPAETTEATVIKVWDDSNNQDGKRPASLTVTLSNGEQVELTAENDWTATVENLPKYKDGVEIAYTWTESTIPDGYELTGTTVDGTVTTLTNHYPAETTEATVIKVWDDSDNQDGKRPASLIVTLSNGTEVTLTEANNWTATVENLPKYADGKEISYTWTEGELPEGYTLTDTAVNGTVTTLTNTYTAEEPELTKATVVKVWDDAANQAGKRPASLTVTLYANGEATANVVTLNEANRWESKIENLPKYADGVEIAYTWTEADMPENYELTSTTVNGTVTTLTNTYTAEEPELTEATVVKVWDDAANQAGKRPESLTVTLYANGEATANVVTLNEANRWESKIENLPKYADGVEIAYTWTEGELPEGYTLTDTTVDGTVTTLTNSYTAEEPELTEATVIKVWDDAANQAGKRPENLIVTLSNGEQVELTAANNWTATVENLPKYKDGVEITYTWTESELPEGYTLTDTTVNGTVTTLTNTYTAEEPELTEATVVKVWDDAANQAGKRPASLTVTLYANGEATANVVTLNEANRWESKIENLPKYADGVEIAYTWTESELPEGYTLTDTAVNGTVTTLTNTYTAEEPELTEATVVKVWDDAANQAGKRPESLIVTLSNGEQVELTAANNWTATVENLPKYKDGKEIAYTWTEAELPEGYTLTNTKVDGTVTTLTNTYTAEEPELTEVTIEKVWIGKDGGEIELVLYANGEILKPQPEVKREGNTYTYTDLPALDAEGKAITYSVRETTMVGYDTTYANAAPNADRTDCAFDGGKIINRELTSFAVRKVWSGLTEGETAPEIELTLYCNGVAMDVRTPAPDADGWYVYNNLPSVVDGKEAVYYAVETPVDGFITTYVNSGENESETECAYNGGTIENAKIPQTGDEAPLALWMVLAAASAAMLLVLRKRRQA